MKKCPLIYALLWVIFFAVGVFTLHSCHYKSPYIARETKDSLYVIEFHWFSKDSDTVAYHQPLIYTGTVVYKREAGKPKRKRLEIQLDNLKIKDNVYIRGELIVIRRLPLSRTRHLRKGSKVKVVEFFYPYHRYELAN